MWPEGTRFTPARKARIEEKNPAARSLQATLPPRTGGVRAVLTETPLDVVFCAHRGFEGVKGLADLWNGELLDRTIEVKLWRTSSPPLSSLEDWLMAQWLQVDAVAAGTPMDLGTKQGA